MSLKPHLACDLELEKVKYPVIGMPKIDGCRGMNIDHAHQKDHTFHGRSLKAYKNKWATERFSGEHFHGLDGEVALGSWTDPALCRNTTGILNRKTAKPGKPTESEDLVWYIFDYLAPHVVGLPYFQRLEAAEQLVQALGLSYVRMVPYKVLFNEAELLAFDAENLDAGFEGSIFRGLEGLHKSGRATVKAGDYLRLKTFSDFEGEVVELIEAMENTNEAKTNELGRTERSSHQENMVPKGMLGMARLRVLNDVVVRGVTLMVKDQIVDVGPGNMTHEQRTEAWVTKKMLKQIWKAKFFPHGQKDKPRFPTLMHERAEEDMSDE